MPHLSETPRLLQSSSFWDARRALIGQLSSVLWLAKYLKHETEIKKMYLLLWVGSARLPEVLTAPLYRNSLWAYLAGYTQVQEIVLRKMAAHTLIFVLNCSGTVL